jgi:hypothetical protein
MRPVHYVHHIDSHAYDRHTGTIYQEGKQQLTNRIEQ